jgi:hypothetical protein
MSETNHHWPWLDLGTYHNNRCRFPPEQLSPYYGKHVAWSLDGLRILASGEDIDDVERQLEAVGVDPSQVVHDYIPPPELVLLGGLFCPPPDQGVLP